VRLQPMKRQGRSCVSAYSLTARSDWLDAGPVREQVIDQCANVPSSLFHLGSIVQLPVSYPFGLSRVPGPPGPQWGDTNICRLRDEGECTTRLGGAGLDSRAEQHRRLQDDGSVRSPTWKRRSTRAGERAISGRKRTRWRQRQLSQVREVSSRGGLGCPPGRHQDEF
jgi:hypothetical protein